MTRMIPATVLAAWFVISAALTAVGQPQGEQENAAFYYARGKKIPVVIAANLQAVRVIEGDFQETARTMADRLTSANDAREEPMLFPDQRIAIVAVPADGGHVARMNAAIEDLPGAAKVETFGHVVLDRENNSPMVLNGKIAARFNADVSEQQTSDIVNQLHLKIVERSKVRPGRVVLVPNEQVSASQLLDAANKLYESGLVSFSQPDMFVQTVKRTLPNQPVIPNDPLFADHWHLNNTGQGSGLVDADVDAAEAWDYSRGSAAVVIAVLDDAVQVNHPDLQPNYLRGRDVIDDDDDPSPEFRSERHGTAVAGVVAARGDNQLGVSGSCPRCSLLAVRMLGGSEAQHAEAFDWAVEQGAQIITNSWGYDINTPQSEDVEDAIENAIQHGRGGLGCAVFFAMTNTNVDNCIGTNPDISSLPGVIAISRSTNLDQLGKGGFGHCMSLIAPTAGGTLGITTTDRTGAAGYATGDYFNNFNGTSSATPLVAGIGGLLVHLNSGLTSRDIKEILEHTADKIDSANANYDSSGFSHTHGHGRANAYRAVVPTVSMRVTPSSVVFGEPFSVTVTASAPYGVQSLSWMGQSTGIASIDAEHLRVFAGSAVASHTWNGITASQAGTLLLTANATDSRFPMPGDGYPHQASDGSGLATAKIIVTAPHTDRVADGELAVPATDITVSAGHESTRIPRVYVVNQNCYDLYEKHFHEVYFDDPKALATKSDAEYLSQDANYYYFSSSMIFGSNREWAFSVEPADTFRGHHIYYRIAGTTDWRVRDGDTVMANLFGSVTSDVAIDHLEITQGLQDASNSIALVRGKPTLVRAFPNVIAGADISGVSARLTASRAGVELPGSPIDPDNGPIDVDAASPDRNLVNDSLNFTLDPDWYGNDTKLSVELVLPTGVSDPDPSNNRDGIEANYVARRGLSIRYLLIEYNNTVWTGQRNPRNRVTDQAACDFLRSIFPADPNTVTYDPWSPIQFTFGQGDASGQLNGNVLITELNTLFAASSNPPDRLFAWTPENTFLSNGLSDPLWAGGQNHVAFGNDTGSETSPPSNSRWRRTFAHEIGHNTNINGLFHTNRRLQGDEFGYDVMRVDPFDRVVMRRYPPLDPQGSLDLFDFMRGGELEPHAWITPPYYNVLFQHLAPANDTEADRADEPAPAAQADAEDVKDLMVVRGQVTIDGQGEFFPFYRVPANDENRKLVLDTPRDGTHNVRFYTGDDEIREARIAWTPDFRLSRDSEKDTLTSRPFTWFVNPIDGVTRVELRARGELIATLVVQQQAPKIQRMENVPMLNALSDTPQQRRIQLQWEIEPLAEDNATTLMHQVYFTADDGKTWQLVASGLKESTSVVNVGSLPGGEKCRFQIRTTDGYNVSIMDGEPFPLETSPPQLKILAPKSDQVYKQGAGILLIGSGYDLKTGKLDGEKLEWTSDLQGALGTGEKLVTRNLKPGKHVIALKATGLSAEADRITVVVKAR